MKRLPLLTVFLFTACSLLGLRADPMADVKALMDTPVVLSYTPSNGRDERDKVGAITNGKQGWEIERAKGIKTSPRMLFTWLSTSQGRSSSDFRLLNVLAKQNSATLRATLVPAFKKASLTSAAADLEEALRLVAASNTLDRSAQDRFARLARVAL